CSVSLPRTLTKTVACDRSFVVCTPVTVTNPIRGSLRDGSASEITFRTTSLTFRRRSALASDDHLPLAAEQLPLLGSQVALNRIEVCLQLRMLAAHARHGKRRPLPEVVMIDLGDRCAEALVQLRLCRLHVLPLALQRPVLGEVQLDRKD